MKYLLLLSVLVSSLVAQQPNHPNATLIDTYLGSPSSVPCLGAVGGYPLCLNMTGIAPLCLITSGLPGSYFEQWITNGPLVPGSLSTPAGLIDLDVANPTLTQLIWGTLDTSGNFVLCVPTFILPASYGFALQAFVVDPSMPTGIRLTAGMNIFHP